MYCWGIPREFADGADSRPWLKMKLNKRGTLIYFTVESIESCYNNFRGPITGGVKYILRVKDRREVSRCVE